MTYASRGFFKQQEFLARSALKLGIGHIELWNRERLCTTAFYLENKAILDQRRGDGYWLWKPYIILDQLERTEPGEFVVYSDCGRSWYPYQVRRPLDPLLDWCETCNGGMVPGVYVPQHGPNRHWTKRECFVVMGCDSPQFWNHPQIQATFSVWQNKLGVIEFLREWLRWCQAPSALTDDKVLSEIKEFPDFIDHRHDQSVLTNLVLMRGVKCFGAPHQVQRGSKDIDNLVDRIAGRWFAIVCRDYYRRLLAKLRLLGQRYFGVLD